MQTIGERLEEARKKKGISIREAAEATKIRGDYLQKFESNHFDIGLTEIYTRGFLRTYANFLKLPAERLLSDYAALGRGDIRPRQPNREVYGRMDISIASTDPADRAANPTEAPPEPSPANRGPQRPRTGSALPTGPDPALVFKYIKWGGAAVIAILLVLIATSIFGGRRSAADSSRKQSTTATQSGPTIGIVAVKQVEVTVRRKNADDSDGEMIYTGTVAAGETKYVPWPGPIFIYTSSTENTSIEIGGKRYPMLIPEKGLVPGPGKGELPAPTP